jgi:hypothetical protein
VCRHAQLLRSDDHVYLVERRNRKWHWHQVGAKSPTLAQSHLCLIHESTAQFPDQWISTRRRWNPSINGFTVGRSRGSGRFFPKIIVRGGGAISTVVAR